MLKIFEDIFDKQWLDELSLSLSKEPWYADNVANRKTWPYKNKGSHLLLGGLYFERINDDKIFYNSNERLTNCLIEAFYYFQKITNKKLKLLEIRTNLQFYGMDGTFHTDGNDQETVFILMLSNESITEDMGGEFYHQPSNTKIPFKQGKLITFNANDLHKASGFNKPYIPRFSIKWRGLK